MSLIPRELLDQISKTSEQMTLITEYMNEMCESLSIVIELLNKQNDTLTDIRNK